MLDNGLQFVSMLFVAMYAPFGTKFFRTVEYHLQPNGQLERFIKK